MFFMELVAVNTASGATCNDVDRDRTGDQNETNVKRSKNVERNAHKIGKTALRTTRGITRVEPTLLR